MPAARTRHPRGRPPLDPATLQALWFEEGDGVALLERGTLLAVIPGWADSSRGMPGYSRDVIGQTPFGWALDDAIDGLGPAGRAGRRVLEVAQLRERLGASSSQARSATSTSRLGPGAHYWDGAPGKRPVDRDLRAAAGPRAAVHRAVHHRDERAADAGRRAGGRRPGRVRRIELAVATTLPPGSGRAGVPVASRVPVARGDLVRSRAQRPLVRQAVDLPARRRLRGRAAARRPVRASRAAASRPVRLLGRR